MPNVATAAACDAIPRTVLALYDGRQDGAAHRSRIHRHAALPLNHLGYRLRYLDVSTPGWSADTGALEGVAAVLSWFTAPPALDGEISNWIAAYRDSCEERPARIVLGRPGLSEGGAFAPATSAITIGIGARVTHRDGKVLPGPGPVPLRPGRYPGVLAAPPAESLLRVDGGAGTVDLIVVSDAGGYAHDSVLIDVDPRGGADWILDPFVFFGQILGAGSWPVPDPTTRTGRRVYLSTVDGSGWTDPLPGQTKGATALLAGQAATDRFITAWPGLPVTVALDPTSLRDETNPGLAGRARAEATTLAAQDHLQLATVADDVDTAGAALIDDLPVSLLLLRGPESTGAEEDVPTMQIDLWAPDLVAPSMIGLPPLTMPASTGHRVLAPLAVDPHGSAFLSLPTILKRTDMPRRLAPFHLFYAADAVADSAARAAVTAYLDLAMTGPFAPVQADAYVRDVEGWESARIVPLGGARWRVEDRGTLQTVRFDAASGRAVQIQRSTGVLGTRRHGDALYVALDPAVVAPIVALSPGTDANGLSSPPTAPVLAEARGVVRDMRRNRCTTELQLETGGETAWWTRPGATVEVTLERDGATLRRDHIQADPSGRVVVDGAAGLPDTTLRLVAPCGGD